MPLIFPALIALFGNRFDALFQLAGWGTSAISGTLKQTHAPAPTDSAHSPRLPRADRRHELSQRTRHQLCRHLRFSRLSRQPRIGFTPLRRLVVGGLSAMIGLVGLSRIYLGHHWFTDVVTSYLAWFQLSGRADLAVPQARTDLSAMNRAKIEVVGHGGAGDFFPGNSRGSMQKAIDLGVDRIEIDILATADGDLVLVHDDTVEIDPGVRQKVRRLPTEHVRGRVDDLLTLDEFFDLIGPSMPVLLDLKRPGYERKIAESGQSPRGRDIWISTTHALSIFRLRSVAPNAKFGLSSGHIATGSASSARTLAGSRRPRGHAGSPADRGQTLRSADDHGQFSSLFALVGAGRARGRDCASQSGR